MDIDFQQLVLKIHSTVIAIRCAKQLNRIYCFVWRQPTKLVLIRLQFQNYLILKIKFLKIKIYILKLLLLDSNLDKIDPKIEVMFLKRWCPEKILKLTKLIIGLQNNFKSDLKNYKLYFKPTLQCPIKKLNLEI